MNKSNWNEEQLKELLRTMPKIKDNRNPEYIYEHISKKRNKRKEKGTWLVPGFASLVAIILFVLFNANFVKYEDKRENELSLQSNATDDHAEVSMKTEQISPERAEQTTQNEPANKTNLSEQTTKSTEQFELMTASETPKTAVYSDDLQGKEVITYGLSVKNKDNIVPVSLIVNKEQSKSWFDQYLENMPRITEETWGGSEYYPLNGTLSFDLEQKAINLDLPIDHQYGVTESEGSRLFNSLITAFRGRSDVDKITFSTAHHPGVSFEKKIVKQIDLTSERINRKPYFLLYQEKNAQPLFVPANESATTIDDALTMMQNEVPIQGLAPSIPKELRFEKISIANGYLTVYISNRTDVPQSAEMNYAIEAILLSAKEFGFSTVEFKHAKTEKVGSFPFNKPIEVPIAANKYEME
ncbi:hypothetical protein [Bacillus sp. T3]|uniref:hypothetical protein n=1 Tax=Bacillus sp. T3 TaxID=467262 RepID=UPI002982B80A|nr:hypothetical protein [Bacillus sp. T3]